MRKAKHFKGKKGAGVHCFSKTENMGWAQTVLSICRTTNTREIIGEHVWKKKEDRLRRGREGSAHVWGGGMG